MHIKDKQITFKDVTIERWPDLDHLFESRGGPKYCWCMLWRRQGEERKIKDNPGRKAALKKRVEGGVPIGILAYLDDHPIAWCSIAPRPTYRPLGGKDYQTDNPNDVWSIVCFFVQRPYRGQGLMRQMIDAAVDHAYKNGAKIVEAYPVQLDSPSYRFMGLIPAFEAAGFQEVGMAGSRRHVMRLIIN